MTELVEVEAVDSSAGENENNSPNSSFSMAHKTPVSWLHEICTRNNVTPKYDLLQIEGAIHEPIFQYRLTLQFQGRFYEENGSGRSKKEAKHNAARAMLRSMQVVAPHELFEMEESMGAIEFGSSSSDMKAIEAEGEANPVGILQELCMKMKYAPPTYEVEGEEGLPHERLFAMACRVGDQFVEIGKGKSKKLAKRTAAYNMAQRLKSMPIQKPTTRVLDDDDDVIIAKIRSLYKPNSARKKKKRKGKKGNETEVGEGKVNYKLWSGPCIDLLRDLDNVIQEPINFVKRLGLEQCFEAIYIDSEELNTDGSHQVFVQLTLEPPLVLIGEGITFREAKRCAAFDVISYFKQMIQ